MRLNFVLDSKGERHSGQSMMRQWATTAALRGQTMLQFLVGTLGYAFLEISDRRFKASVCIDKITDGCLSDLIYEMISYDEVFGQGVVIAEDNNSIHQFDNGRAALKFMLLRWKNRQERSQSKFTRKSVVMTDPARTAFRELAAVCSSAEQFNMPLVNNILRASFQDRYCIVRPDHDGDRLILIGFGSGYAHLDEDWSKRNVGTPFGEFKDRDYTAFVQKAYQDAWKECRPILEQIDAPSFADPLPRRYERILLPIRFDTGRAMLSATMIGT